MKTLPGLAALALLALPAAAAAAPPTAHQLSIAAKPATVVYGKAVSITGQLTGADNGGETVVLENDPFPFDTFKNLDTTQTSATGAYAFTATPTVNTKYRANAKSKSAATSPEVLVKVAPKVALGVSDKKPKKGQTVRFSGTVTPEHDGQTVLLQRQKSGGGWKTVKTVVLADAGTSFSVYTTQRAITRSGTYRVVKPADADHARGHSPKRKLTVH